MMETEARLRTTRVAACAWFATWAWTLFGLGTLKPGYSHASQFISELNATGTPMAHAVSWLGFMPVGVLLLVLAFAAAPVVRVRGASRAGFWLLFTSQSFAYLAAAVVPCDAGCPATGSTSQLLHNLSGLVSYPLGLLGVVLLATAPGLRAMQRGLLVTCALAWCAGFVLMLAPELDAVRGLAQRMIELAMVVAIACVVFGMTRMEPRRRD